ncbi:MAG: hypothetical protein AMJ54_08740 [Deltaproteobacteria bacterium SG8_13]|nr:MAG: hypothetical protein AMJ54_08740 [Deltaproteobacteria bacterium SG8_13]
MIVQIARLLKILNSESEPGQISLAFCFSMVAGLTPALSAHNLLVLLAVLLLRVNLSAFLLGWLFFSASAYLLDPIFHRIGLAVLSAAALEGLWTYLYNIPMVRFTRFNNTVVMGSLVFAVAGFVPLYYLSNTLIFRYRDRLLGWVRNTRWMAVVKATRVYSAYERLAGWGGGA